MQRKPTLARGMPPLLGIFQLERQLSSEASRRLARTTVPPRITPRSIARSAVRHHSRTPVPMRSTMPAFNKLDANPSGGPEGHVVAVRDDISDFGAGHVIYTDLGRPSVRPGDVITLFRDRERGLPRLMLGQAVVLTVASETSTAKITRSTQESRIGDRVERVQ